MMFYVSSLAQIMFTVLILRVVMLSLITNLIISNLRDLKFLILIQMKRHLLYNFFHQNMIFFEKGNTELECIKTQSDSIYLIKKTCRYVAESTFDMYSNFPKLIFVAHSQTWIAWKFVDAAVRGACVER